MPRKEPYVKKKKRLVEVYDNEEYDADDTLEAIKKEASRMTNRLVGWKKDQYENNPEDAVDLYDRLGHFQKVEKCEKQLQRIYYRNRAVMEAEMEAENARLAKDAEGFVKWNEKVVSLEEEQVGAWWTIYRIYTNLTEQITIRTLRQIQGKEEDESADLIDDYEQSNDELERMGGV